MDHCLEKEYCLHMTSVRFQSKTPVHHYYFPELSWSSHLIALAKERVSDVEDILQPTISFDRL